MLSLSPSAWLGEVPDPSLPRSSIWRPSCPPPFSLRPARQWRREVSEAGGPARTRLGRWGSGASSDRDRLLRRKALARANDRRELAAVTDLSMYVFDDHNLRGTRATGRGRIISGTGREA